MKRWILIAIPAVLVVALIGVAVVQANRVPVQAATAANGPVQEFIDERATSHLSEIYEITMPFAGRINQLAVDIGDPIAEGERLVQISEQDLANEVAQAQAVVDRLNASIIENDDARLEQHLRQQSDQFVESMRFTVGAAEVRAEVSEDRMQYAERLLGRMREMFAESATSEDSVDVAELRFKEAEKGVTQDNFVLSAVQAIFAATNLMPEMIDDVIDKKSLSRAVLEEQRNEAITRLNEAQTRQARASMISPIDGVVLERAVFSEQFLPAGTDLITIGDLNQLEIETHVLSQDVVDIKVGDPVEIYGPTTGAELGDGFSGRVSRISPSGFSKLSSLGVEQQRVRVMIQIDNDDRDQLLQRGVGVDYRLRVRVFTDEVEDALRIPRNAIFRGADGTWQTFVIRSGAVKQVSVDVGLMNDHWVQVVDGVEPGERVVLSAENSLGDGDRVRVIND